VNVLIVADSLHIRTCGSDWLLRLLDAMVRDRGVGVQDTLERYHEDGGDDCGDVDDEEQAVDAQRHQTPFQAHLLETPPDAIPGSPSRNLVDVPPTRRHSRLTFSLASRDCSFIMNDRRTRFISRICTEIRFISVIYQSKIEQ